MVVLPHSGVAHYSLWIYVPLPDRQVAYYVCELSEQIDEAMRMASTLCFYSPRPLHIVEYNAKRMASRGDDLIFFGKYRGHYLHEVLRIDPAYLSWIAYKFEPRIPKQARFVQIAKIYHSVYMDAHRQRARAHAPQSRHLGKVGERIGPLQLTVEHVRVEDDPYKTQVRGNTTYYFVRQVLHLHDAQGNRVSMRVNARIGSLQSGQLPAGEHAYSKGDTVRIESARVAQTYHIGKQPCTRINYVRGLQTVSPSDITAL